MEKNILNHHASTVLAKCYKTKEFLLGQYDSEYPGKNKHWIGRVKFLGGNYFFGKDNDKSPEETLFREIEEEFSGKRASEGEMASNQQHNFASLKEIKLVRNALLKVVPFQDYFLHHPGPEDKPQTYVIQSVFQTELSENLMHLVKHNLSKGLSLTNEGFLVVKTLEELVAGNPLTQGITGLIIGQTEGIIFPYCFKDLFTFASIGEPRDSYEAYLDKFEYRNHSKK